jgi:hypothetical protein
MTMGMRGFVKQTLGLGFDSQRLHLQQKMMEEEGGQAPASVKLMQENARLIILTKEVSFCAIRVDPKPNSCPPLNFDTVEVR